LFFRAMEIINSIHEMKRWSLRRLMNSETIGLVPTMGYLHEGHLSLMSRARSENFRLAASIFVNPIQFGRNEDLGSYPRDPESDKQKCLECGVEALFMPEASDMYGSDFHTHVDVDRISAPLCGASRPGHFRGVATVVLKLFNIVRPTSAYFGMKDYQQLQVIRTMVNDLNLGVVIVPCPTVREPDGLAMSSRNSYLSPGERKQAPALYEGLIAAKSLFEQGQTDAAVYLRAMKNRIANEPDATIDYVNLVNPETLEDLERVDNSALAVMAVRIGKTRLIDNMLFQK
jgi:pantoate--beta-alanine ligase